MASAMCSALLLAAGVLVSAAYSAGADPSFKDSQLSDSLLEEIYSEMVAQLAAEKSQELNGFDEGWYTRPPPVDETIGYDYAPTAMDSSLKWVNARRPEEEDQVVPTGYQHMSGGAGEGLQHLKPQGSVTNKQQVKTDADLPSYCSPPNPCPKGKTAADGCQEGVPDTADFNRNYILRQMQAGYCGCDYEHMAQDVCPQQLAGQGGVQMPDIDEMLDEIMESEVERPGQNPYLSDGEKRKSMTAKKGGQHVIMKRNAKEVSSVPTNPFLQGIKLPVVAKKSPRMD